MPKFCTDIRLFKCDCMRKKNLKILFRSKVTCRILLWKFEMVCLGLIAPKFEVPQGWPFGGYMLVLNYQVHGEERFPKLFSYEKLFVRFAKYQGHPTKSFGHNNICSSEAAQSGMSYISQLGSVKNTHLAARNPILQRILTARCPWNIKMWNGPIARKAKVLRCPNFLLILDFLSVTVWAKKNLKILFRSKNTCRILLQNLKRCV